MYDNHNDDWANQANRVPPLFAILEPVRNDDMQWVVPYTLCEFEGDSMFGQVDPCLFQIPLEAHGNLIYVH